MRNSLLCLLGLMLLCGSGCSSRLGDFTVLLSKNVNLADFSTVSGTGGERVRGEDVMTIVLFVNNKPMGPNMKEAVDSALEGGNAYMLSDAVLKYEYFYAVVFAQGKYVVEGHPAKR
jgi:hypothetical protein